jgi:hypothetical protein
MFRIPNRADEISVSLLDAAVSQMHPGASVIGFELGEIRRPGDAQVSTAGRVNARLAYGPGSPPLPERVLIKTSIDEAPAPECFYRTEVEIYRRILPQLDIEKPVCVAAAYDAETGHFLLALEDLSVGGARFPNVLQPSLSPEQVGSGLDLLAIVHARYWRSPQLDAERGWLSSLLEGDYFDFFEGNAVRALTQLVAGSSYRRDLLARVGRSPAQLWAYIKAVHRHQANTLPPTLQHGDTGAHNSYHLPDGRMGFLDWQLAVRGTWPHDVHYHICTALSVADRRTHEKQLVQRYLARLKALGVPAADIPSIEDAMREIGRALVWGFTVGWLMVPERGYGMEIISTNLERLFAACLDHRTFELADEVTARCAADARSGSLGKGRQPCRNHMRVK